MRPEEATIPILWDGRSKAPEARSQRRGSLLGYGLTVEQEDGFHPPVEVDLVRTARHRQSIIFCSSNQLLHTGNQFTLHNPCPPLSYNWI